MQLRPYQVRAVAELYKAITEGHRRILLVAPTGSGKTVMASRIMRDATVKRDKRVLFLAHRQELVFQCSEKLRAWGVPHGIIMAGEEALQAYEHPCQVASIASLMSDERVLPPADIIVIDEAHRQDSKKLTAFYPDALLLGLTATPKRLRGKRMVNLHGEWDTLVIAANQTELLACGAIVKGRVYAPTVPDLTPVADVNGDYQTRKLSEIMQDPLIIGDVVEHWKRHRPNGPTLVFAVDVAHAKKLHEAFTAEEVTCELVLGNLSSDDRRGALSRLRFGRTAVVVSCAVLVEGYDLPHLACVVLARPTRSLTMYLQQVGRAVRPAPGKDSFILLDHGANVLAHGSPNRDHKWSLAKTVLKKSQAPELWRCPQCYAVLPPPPPDACPYCGQFVTKETKARRIQWEDGTLREWNEDELAALNARLAKEEAEKTYAKEQRKSLVRQLWAVSYKLSPHLTSDQRRRWVLGQAAEFDRSGKDVTAWMTTKGWFGLRRSSTTTSYGY